MARWFGGAFPFNVTKLPHDFSGLFHYFCAVKIPLSLFIALALSSSWTFAVDVQQLESRSSQGDADARFELGRACLKGDGITKNATRALELMRSAADQGHPEAMGGVGYFYANGIVVPKDMEKAVEWFRKGAEAGGAKAQLNLGNLLAMGNGVEKNEAEGKKWIKAAAAQDLPEALWSEGCIHYFGKYGEPVDYPVAYPFLIKAARQGHPDSQNLVGVMLENGQGVDANEQDALDWFRKAAESGLVKSQMNLGRLLGPESPDQSRRLESLAWLALASDQEDVTAQKLFPPLSPDELAQVRKLAADLKKSIASQP